MELIINVINLKENYVKMYTHNNLNFKLVTLTNNPIL